MWRSAIDYLVKEANEIVDMKWRWQIYSWTHCVIPKAICLCSHHLNFWCDEQKPITYYFSRLNVDVMRFVIISGMFRICILNTRLLTMLQFHIPNDSVGAMQRCQSLLAMYEPIISIKFTSVLRISNIQLYHRHNSRWMENLFRDEHLTSLILRRAFCHRQSYF